MYHWLVPPPAPPGCLREQYRQSPPAAEARSLSQPSWRGPVQCWLRGASSSQSQTPLHYAAKEGHLNSIRLLLVYGADPNARDEDGYTPLHYVCQIYSPGVERCDGIRKCVETLIEFGADIRAETNSGCTPGDLAQRQNNSVCLEAVNRAWRLWIISVSPIYILVTFIYKQEILSSCF